MIKFVTSFPLPVLNPYIEKYVFYKNENISNDVELTFFSNGKLEMFIHYNGSHIIISRKKKCLTNFMVGISELTHKLKIWPKAMNGCFNGIAVTFSFYGVVKLLGFQPISFTNRVLPIESIMGENGRKMTIEISRANNCQEQEDILNRFFLSLMNKRKENPFRIHNLYELIIEQNGFCSVYDLANHLNLSTRTIHRMFNKQIGIGPKDYLKIIRFNHACKLISNYPDIDWFEIICSCGYYDQMHFIREFKKIMRYTPMEFLKISRGNFYFGRPILIL